MKISDLTVRAGVVLFFAILPSSEFTGLSPYAFFMVDTLCFIVQNVSTSWISLWQMKLEGSSEMEDIPSFENLKWSTTTRSVTLHESRSDQDTSLS